MIEWSAFPIGKMWMYVWNACSCYYNYTTTNWPNQLIPLSNMLICMWSAINVPVPLASKSNWWSRHTFTSHMYMWIALCQIPYTKFVFFQCVSNTGNYREVAELTIQFKKKHFSNRLLWSDRKWNWLGHLIESKLPVEVNLRVHTSKNIVDLHHKMRGSIKRL